jgi:hypothetical protein
MNEPTLNHPLNKRKRTKQEMENPKKSLSLFHVNPAETNEEEENLAA